MPGLERVYKSCAVADDITTTTTFTLSYKWAVHEGDGMYDDNGNFGIL
jgi:hypothetical protein